MDQVLGFHGTSRECADKILNLGFRPSRNDYDWLGSGLYLFERSLAPAWAWATERHGPDNAAVLRVRVDLDGCMDLTDDAGRALLRPYYSAFVEVYGVEAVSAIRQTRRAPRLDSAVINFAVPRLLELGVAIRSVRGAFLEGAPLWSDDSGLILPSTFFDRTHVQICVRDLSAVLEVELLASADARR